MDTRKTLKNSLQFIDSVLADTDYEAVDWPFEASGIAFKRENRKMNMTFDAHDGKKLHDAYMGRLKGLSIKSHKVTLKIPEGYSWFNCPYQFCAGSMAMSMAVSVLYTSNFDTTKKTFLRVFQPIDRFDLYHDIRTFGYYEESYWRLGWMGISLSDGTIEVFPYDCNGQKYVVFESQETIDAKTFSKKIYSICVVLGLITRTIWLDEAFCVEYSDGNFDTPVAFQYQTLRPSINGSYSIFSTNIFVLEDSLSRSETTRYAADFLKDEAGEVKRGMIDWLQPDFLSSMCAMIDDNDSLCRAASMITEASTYPVEYQASLFYTALETITSFLKKKYRIEYRTPIPKDIFKKEIVLQFRKAMKECETRHPELHDGIRILEDKINNLNAPTNLDKLALPFEIINYTLIQEETAAIKNRNRFMHGSLLVVSPKGDEFDALLGNCIRLHKLCCILLLKEAGFDSYILNNPVLYGLKEECEAKQPPVITLNSCL